jgi:hypothetical protein
VRLRFRGIYFPRMGKGEWVKLIAQNRRTILKLIAEAFGKRSMAAERRETTSQIPDPEMTV